MCTAKGETVRYLLSYTHCQLCLSGVPTSPPEGFSTAQNSDQSYETEDEAHAVGGYHSLLVTKFTCWKSILIGGYGCTYYVLRHNLAVIFISSHGCTRRMPVAARSKAWVCGCSLAGIAGSNPARTWMFVSCKRCVLSGRGLCDGLITRPEESY